MKSITLTKSEVKKIKHEVLEEAFDKYDNSSEGLKYYRSELVKRIKAKVFNFRLFKLLYNAR